MKKRTVAIIIVAMVLIISFVLTLFYTGFLALSFGSGKAPITSVDLHALGFRVVAGSISDYPGVIFLTQRDDFVNLAHEWNVTTVFLSYDAVMFGYDGVIYCYSW
jgi:hypothetical protein